MKVLLDEDVSKPVVHLVEYLLRSHEVHSVRGLNWSGKKDIDLIADAAQRGFQVFITQNVGQFNVPKECDAIQKSGMHHVSYEVPTGLAGLGLASGALCAAILPVVADLETRNKQHIVKITGLDKNRKRFEVTDPSVTPPSDYWR